MQMFSLEGRVALVTGAGRGIGRALALGLADAGADVVCLARTQAEVEAAAEEVRAKGRRAMAGTADVTNQEQVASAVEAAIAEFGKVDILVNNAGINIRKPALEVEEQDWDRVVATNLKGPFLLAQAAAPLMRRDGGGVIVNIADLSGLQPWPAFAHHSVSKAGLIHLTRVLARALAPDIRANCIAPGTVLPPEDYTVEQVERLRAKTALQRLGSPDDVARALLFLVESDFVTGECIVVDGGRMLL